MSQFEWLYLSKNVKGVTAEAAIGEVLANLKEMRGLYIQQRLTARNNEEAIEADAKVNAIKEAIYFIGKYEAG